MKAKRLILTVLFLFVFSLINAQNEKFKHFEADLGVNFWSPSSIHLKGSNSLTRIQYNGTSVGSGGISGYGTSFAPKFNLTYRFKNNLGVSLGFYPVITDNELFVQKTDTTFSGYENMSSIINFTLGLTGNVSTNSVVEIYYGFGLNFIPNYEFTMHVSTETGSSSDLEASDIAGGPYFKTGMKIKLYKFLYFKSGMEFSIIPTELEYTNSEGVTYNEKTNIGGLGLHVGLSFVF
jgi:hypothetical protein